MKDLLKKLWNNVNGVSESDFFIQQEIEGRNHCTEIDYSTRLEEDLEREALEMDLIDWPIYPSELQFRTLKNDEKDVEEKESEPAPKSGRRWPIKHPK